MGHVHVLRKLWMYEVKVRFSHTPGSWSVIKSTPPPPPPKNVPFLIRRWKKLHRGVHHNMHSSRSTACTKWLNQVQWDRRDVQYAQKGKGKVCPRRGREGPEWEQKYSYTLSLTSALDGARWLQSWSGRGRNKSNISFRKPKGTGPTDWNRCRWKDSIRVNLNL